MGRSGADWEAAKQRLARLELENDRLRHDLERNQRLTSSTSASHDLDRLQVQQINPTITRHYLLVQYAYLKTISI